MFLTSSFSISNLLTNQKRFAGSGKQFKISHKKDFFRLNRSYFIYQKKKLSIFAIKRKNTLKL